MRKTHKQLAEVQDFTLDDYRVSPHHVAQIQRRNQANHIIWQPDIMPVKNPAELPGEVIPITEAPSRVVSITHDPNTLHEITYDRRLEHIQALGEQALQAEAS